jgi:hypothetical protein
MSSLGSHSSTLSAIFVSPFICQLLRSSDVSLLAALIAARQQ